MSPLRERGAALLILFVMLTALAASVGMGLLQSAARGEPAQQQQLRTLALAADALRGEAFRRRCEAPTVPDEELLPCPDAGGVEGEAGLNCAGTTRGWLPWRTLGLPPLRDASGTCLWYERQDVTARVIAAGPANAAQNRSAAPGRPVCGGNHGTQNYLDATDNGLTITLDTAAMAARCP